MPLFNVATGTKSTRFLILSDTHNFEFDDDPEEAEDIPLNFHQHALPKADVLLHCGDLTELGGSVAYTKCLQMLSNFDAELKLVIAGNHDLDLDLNHRADKTSPDRKYVDSLALSEHAKAKEIMKGFLAKEAGVTYLEEGTHEFMLSNGTRFSIYVSQFTPNFYDWAFPYERSEDRFNDHSQTAEGQTSIATNPIPSFPNVHILMTHGPPHKILDECWGGNVGCGNLLRGSARARPLLHCFGHIHEGHGAKLVTWDAEETKDAIPEKNAFPEVNQWPIEFGRQTLMVNAAIRDERNHPGNAPWLIDLELPVSSE